MSLPDGETVIHELYVRSYPDNPRGYAWYSEDTLFISSAISSVGSQEDMIGYFNITNDEMNNIVGGEHPVDYARQGTISPNGKLIAYSGFYKNNNNYAHCIFDTETGETTYWYDKGSSGLTDTVNSMSYNPFLDDEHILKMRTYNMSLDADGNIVYDETPEIEQELSEAEEPLTEENGPAPGEVQPEENETGEAAEPSETETQPGNTSEEDESSGEERRILVNSIFSFNVFTGEQELLIEHAYRPCLSKDRTKIYFHLTAYSPLVEGENLSQRVFCYDISTGEITEVTESLGISSSYDIILLEQRLNGYGG